MEENRSKYKNSLALIL